VGIEKKRLIKDRELCECLAIAMQAMSLPVQLKKDGQGDLQSLQPKKKECVFPSCFTSQNSIGDLPCRPFVSWKPNLDHLIHPSGCDHIDKLLFP